MDRFILHWFHDQPQLGEAYYYLEATRSVKNPLLTEPHGTKFSSDDKVLDPQQKKRLQ